MSEEIRKPGMEINESAPENAAAGANVTPPN